LFTKCQTKYALNKNDNKIGTNYATKQLQNDAGGKFLLEDNWTTFQKARLNCSRSGDYPFYFDELQSTVYDRQHALIYAVFSTPASVDNNNNNNNDF